MSFPWDQALSLHDKSQPDRVGRTVFRDEDDEETDVKTSDVGGFRRLRLAPGQN